MASIADRLLLVLVLVACSSGSRTPGPTPGSTPEAGTPTETHFVVQYATDGRPAADVTVFQRGADGKEQHTPDPKGLVPRTTEPRHVEVHHTSGHVLYRGAFPEDSVLEVPPPLHIAGSLAAFGDQPRVLVGHGQPIELSSYLRREHDLPRPTTVIPEVEDLVPSEWVEVPVGPDGSFSSDLVLPRPALAVVVLDADGAYAAVDLDAEDSTGDTLTLPSDVVPLELGRIEITLPPDTPGDWLGRLRPLHEADSPERRAAALLHGADEERGRLLSGRRAVELGRGPVTLDGIPAGPWEIRLHPPRVEPGFTARVEVPVGASVSWSPTPEDLKAASTQDAVGASALSDFCKVATNWSTIGEYTGPFGGTDFVPIIGLFVEDRRSTFWATYPNKIGTTLAWDVPTLKQLRCSSSDCKTIGTIDVFDFPSWAVNPPYVKGGAMYSPWLVGVSAPEKVVDGGMGFMSYDFAAAVNLGVKGTVKDSLKVYVIGPDGNQIQTGTQVTFGSPLDGSTPAVGAVGDGGYVLVRDQAGNLGPIHCANTPNSPLGLMSVTVTYEGDDFTGACMGYTAESGNDACVVVELRDDAKVYCNQNATCVP